MITPRRPTEKKVGEPAAVFRRGAPSTAGRAADVLAFAFERGCGGTPPRPRDLLNVPLPASDSSRRGATVPIPEFDRLIGRGIFGQALTQRSFDECVGYEHAGDHAVHAHDDDHLSRSH